MNDKAPAVNAAPVDDVLVVGAGPAGSVAARQLARAGLRVRLIDRSGFPRPKLCGDTVNPGAVATLERLGLGAVTQGSAPLGGIRLVGPVGVDIVADYPGVSGVAIARDRLDAALLEAAVAAGVVFESGVTARAVLRRGDGRVCGIEAARGGRPVSLLARVVVAADGRRSRLASSAGLAALESAPARWAYGFYAEGMTGLDGRIEMHVRADGYIGVAPLAAGVANVCVVRTRHDWQHALRSATAASPAAAVLGFLAADPHLGRRWDGVRVCTPVVGLGPLAWRVGAVGCPGFVLAGDAAGFVDPITGDGIGFAIRGGELAAAAVLREWATGDPAERTLAAARVRAFGRKVRLNRAIRGLTSSPVLIHGAARLASVCPSLIRWLALQAGDIPEAAA